MGNHPVPATHRPSPCRLGLAVQQSRTTHLTTTGRPGRGRDLALTLLTAALAASVTVGLAVRPPAADGIGRSKVVDAPADYEAQRTCRKSPLPGTVAMARWLQRSYPVTGSLGLMRACGIGGTSEHKDGRAFDWAADVARPRQRKAALRFINRALATDKAGNEHALARRLGIMYLIYNDTIWSSYRGFEPRRYLNSACPSRRKCTRSLRHLDHVHISLSFAGASGQTSWYRKRGVRALPVFYPGTRELDPDQTAVIGMSVPADGTLVNSPFRLRAGITYRIVATGTTRYGRGLFGDPNCVWEAGASTLAPTRRGELKFPALPDLPDPGDWSWNSWEPDPEGSDHDPSPFAAPITATRGLLIRGALRWSDQTCRSDHTYEAWFTPRVDQRLKAAYFDPWPNNNKGSFTVYVARDDIVRSSLKRR